MTSLLLDTQVLLRAAGLPDSLSEDVLALPQDRDTDEVYSGAVSWIDPCGVRGEPT